MHVFLTWKPFVPDLSNSVQTSHSGTLIQFCFICSFFKESFDDVQDHINTVKDRENEIDFDPKEDGLEINNSTHTRKVKRSG